MAKIKRFGKSNKIEVFQNETLKKGIGNNVDPIRAMTFRISKNEFGKGRISNNKSSGAEKRKGIAAMGNSAHKKSEVFLLKKSK